MRSVDNDLVSSTTMLTGPTAHSCKSNGSNSLSLAQLVLTEATRQLAEGFVNVLELGRQSVKGVREPILCYVLKDPSKARTSWKRQEPPGLSSSRLGRDRGTWEALRDWT